LAINGHAQFFEALRTSEIDYHAYYRSLNPEESYRIMRNQLAASGGVPTTAQLESLDRRFPENPSGLGKLNVVVVMEESLGAEFSASLGGKKDLTPHLDAYGREGLWFTHMYAQGTRTVRGLEAISSSFPPIPTVSIVRRPNNSNIATWGKVMKAAGYSTSFLYGGYGYFDNINTFFEGNGYEVVDRTAMPKARFENIWGVSDEDLFDAAMNHFDQKAKSGRPFFAQIMTTSNHKPFTFRPGIPGIPERGGGREAGVRYADFALDYFLKEARRHSWFDNTLFVIVADHGARVYGKSQIPIRSYEIPCLIWAPKHVKPAAIDELASQIDLAPTVLGLLGLPYQAPFFGRDILADTPNPPIMLFSHNHDVGLYDGEHLIVLGMQRQVWNYRYDRTADHLIESPHDPNLEKLAVSYYQTASELFRDNRYE
jgi:phosphoglycerol transferase MdoB-like AlkP superfamily enzyme